MQQFYTEEDYKWHTKRRKITPFILNPIVWTMKKNNLNIKKIINIT